MTPERSVPVICACFILHNIALLQNDHMQLMGDDAIDDGDVAVADAAGQQDGTRMRQHVTNTFFNA